MQLPQFGTIFVVSLLLISCSSTEKFSNEQSQFRAPSSDQNLAIFANCGPSLGVFMQSLNGIYGPEDFPIQLIYPYEKIYPGKVHRESLAFRHWRHLTPEHIPDEAFNAHYISRAEWEQNLAERAGYAVSHAETHTLVGELRGLDNCPACQRRFQAALSDTRLKSIKLEKYLQLPNAKSLVNLLKAQSLTSQELLSKLKIDPELHLGKVEEIAGAIKRPQSNKYLVDSSGTSFVFSAQDQEKIAVFFSLPPTEEFTHPQLANLLYADRAELPLLVGAGYFEAAIENGALIIRSDVGLPMLNTSVLDFTSYFSKYVGLLK